MPSLTWNRAGAPVRDRSRAWTWLAAPAIILGLWIAYSLAWGGGAGRLVVYCAHDSIHAEAVLREFERQSGIPVAIRFDTEATKSLGLVELLIREANAPRCDVFWNNQLLSTLDLERRGLLEAYRGPGYRRIPADFRDPEGRWTGFAARLRVYIVNVEQLAADPEAISGALAGDLRRVAIARPLFGTTLTHYAVLWHAWGPERLEAWHRDWRRRGVREVTGNAQVKSLVAAGVCRLGLTDTDDYFVARDEGKPVAMVPFRTDLGEVICIPNTVAIIRGTRRLEAARKLVDFLLSSETEVRLANARGRQVPLGDVPAERLPDTVRELRTVMRHRVALPALVESRAACLAWLRSEAVR